MACFPPAPPRPQFSPKIFFYSPQVILGKEQERLREEERLAGEAVERMGYVLGAVTQAQVSGSIWGICGGAQAQVSRVSVVSAVELMQVQAPIAPCSAPLLLGQPRCQGVRQEAARV